MGVVDRRLDQQHPADPDRPAHFTEKAVYALDGVDGLVKRVAFSKLGLMAVSVFARGDDGHEGFELHLFKLPGSGSSLPAWPPEDELEL